MKGKLYVLLAGLMVCVSFTGCGSTEEDPQTDTTVQAEVTEDTQENAQENAQESVQGDPILKSFTANTLDGATYTNEDMAAKDVTMINCWSTTCPPCIGEMPELAELEKSLPENVQLITVCLDGEDYSQDAEAILTEAGYEGITLVSGDGDLATVCADIMYVPTTLIVDSEGNIMGEPIIGAPQDPLADYKAAINDALTALGKPGI